MVEKISGDPPDDSGKYLDRFQGMFLKIAGNVPEKFG